MTELDLSTLWRAIDEGSTPAIAAIAYFLWRLDKTMTGFIGEVRATMESRDKKLSKIDSDIGAMIRKLAGLGGDNA